MISTLTERQQMIAVMVRCGMTNKEIAYWTRTTPGCVRNTLALMYRRLGITGVAGIRRTKLAVMVAEAKKEGVEWT